MNSKQFPDGSDLSSPLVQTAGHSFKQAHIWPTNLLRLTTELKPPPTATPLSLLHTAASSFPGPATILLPDILTEGNTVARI